MAPVPSPVPEKRGAWKAVLGVIVLLALAGTGIYLLLRATGVIGTAKVKVPDVRGLTADEAKRRLEAAGFEVTTQFQNSDTVPENQVIDTDPGPGSSAAKGATVKMIVSRGSSAVDVPDVVGKSETAARSTLGNAGFEVAVERRADDTRPEGTVIAQDPAAGSKAPKGSTVTITVSAGKEKVSVPDVSGLKQADAENQIEAAGLEATVVTQESSSVPVGYVIRTIPEAESQVSKGSTVTLVVSSGVTVTMPGVIGDNTPDAKATLEALGLVVTVVDVVVSQPSEVGKVQGQDPPEGTTLHKGDPVTIQNGKLLGP